ncbi:collagen alpha-4(IV) chain-like [Vidua chalybeata]|uniref:collagen alpha-4(IV) chain-like n=1 Tax=Vidua chalybeata TaxID=81927 RepID=UPI0023A819E4|nr:collagen alpha-4(IV) chain-like [Vidua chalybeata]XP_053809193.1 collagen alpha-4(IV) chain-like [Vidua chalybeata]
MKEAKEMFRQDQGICSPGRIAGNAGAGRSGKGSLGRFILGACSAVKCVLPMVLHQLITLRAQPKFLLQPGLQGRAVLPAPGPSRARGGRAGMLPTLGRALRRVRSPLAARCCGQPGHREQDRASRDPSRSLPLLQASRAPRAGQGFPGSLPVPAAAPGIPGRTGLPGIPPGPCRCSRHPGQDRASRDPSRSLPLLRAPRAGQGFPGSLPIPAAAPGTPGRTRLPGLPPDPCRCSRHPGHPGQDRASRDPSRAPSRAPSRSLPLLQAPRASRAGEGFPGSLPGSLPVPAARRAPPGGCTCAGHPSQVSPELALHPGRAGRLL